MAYPAPRSMNADLEEGMSDGKYKKIVMNRGGVTEGRLFYEIREPMYDMWYGIHETPEKRFPDGTRSQTPYFVANDRPTDGAENTVIGR